MSCGLTLLAKAPVPGFAKTRLIPALGAEGAARLAAQLLAHAVAAAHAAGFDSLRLLGAPDASHPALQRHAEQAELGAQGDGDLGARMHRALAFDLQRHEGALLIGTDAPALDASRLREAADALHEVDAVFVPALDGGYALVGLRRPCEALFSGMAWSTAQVMADTRARARDAGLRWIELAPVADIDEPADLAHLPPGWRP
jgi:rSAM/selenodomain-associated transferase 1